MNVTSATAATPARGPFLAGVFLITFSGLLFQIVQTRVLSVIAWYYLAFFAISVAMLGMTIGAVWVYLRREHFKSERLASIMSDHALACALAMPISLILQFTLIIKLTLSVTTIFAWIILMSAMTVPYIFAGVVVSLALTRSTFPVGQVYGVDLLGAALGCVAVIPVLNFLDGPSSIILAGFISALAAWLFARSATSFEQAVLGARSMWRRPLVIACLLLLGLGFNHFTPLGLKPLIVKDQFEPSSIGRFEKWNSYSRIVASRPFHAAPRLWGPSKLMPADIKTDRLELNIDGLAGTEMYRYNGAIESVDFLKYDLVNLAYHLPGINKSAVIGVGGGRDLLSAHLFGVKDITGVELNPIFVRMHTDDPFFSKFSNLLSVPNLKLHVDDARSWFASTEQRFDLIQMSMIDTWAATGAGAFSLSENGLYTLEGWRAFIGRLNPAGVFTVSRWYNPGDNNETGRMVSLATAAVLDSGAADARPHMYVAAAEGIATLVLSRSPFTAEQLEILNREVAATGFKVLFAPDQPPESELLRGIIAAKSVNEIDQIVDSALLDLSVATDNRPFFFNQLRLSHIPETVISLINGTLRKGVLRGNLFATAALLMILVISIFAVVATVLVPLRGAARQGSSKLIVSGSLYFTLIGMGFMFAEISMLQYFSVYLGHPIYSLGVCLFSLILATGLGSLLSGWINPESRAIPRKFLLIWSLIVGAYLLCMQQVLGDVFEATTAQTLSVRIAVSLAVVVPLGLLLGFAFPTGMRLVEAVDRQPTPWFWGINGATGVLASVLAVLCSMSWGISLTMSLAALCYLALIPVAFNLSKLGDREIRPS